MRKARRPFVVVSYGPSAAGTLTAMLPEAGYCSALDDRKCSIVRSYCRGRKTGPRHPLLVVRCRTHGVAFTLYPPGYVPYGRAPVAPVEQGDAEADAGGAALADTVLEAAQDAAQGAAWPRECEGGSSKWWGTQCRQVSVATALCGVLPDLDAAARQAQAAALWTPLLLLLQGAKAIAAAPGYRSRGQAVMAVLDRVAPGPCVLQRVLAAGHLAGLWGAPWRWDQDARQLRRWSFRGDGTRPP